MQNINPKAKGNPRRILLRRIILLNAIIIAVFTFVIVQLQPEHLYLVYEIRAEDNFTRNLYLYDATTGETVRQITHNEDSGKNIVFDTAENAPYVLYQYLSPYENFPVKLINLKTGREREILPANDGTWSHTYNLQHDAQYVAYQERDDSVISTYLINLHSGEQSLVHEFDYASVDDEVYAGTMGILNWTDNSLMMTYFDSDHHTVYAHNLHSGITSHLVNTAIRNGHNFPGFSDDEMFVTYSMRTEASPLRIQDASGSVLPLPTLDDTWDLIDANHFEAWRPASHDLFVWIGEPYSEPPPNDENWEPVYWWHIAILNIDSNEIHDLSDGRRYYQYRPQWNGSGTHLLYNRIDAQCNVSPVDCSDYVIYDMQTGERTTLPYYPTAEWIRIP